MDEIRYLAAENVTQFAPWWCRGWKQLDQEKNILRVFSVAKRVIHTCSGQKIGRSNPGKVQRGSVERTRNGFGCGRNDGLDPVSLLSILLFID